MIRSGCTMTTPSYSNPLQDSGSTTETRSDTGTNGSGVITPTVPSTAASNSSIAASTAGRSPPAGTNRWSGSYPVARTAFGRSASGTVAAMNRPAKP